MSHALLQQLAQETFQHEGLSREVFIGGQGPAVVVIHELPGITPEVLRFAFDLIERGFTVALPSLCGQPGRAKSVPSLVSALTEVCVAREFHTLARRRSSPVTHFLRALARRLHERCGGPGVGVVGMCFTGNFALAMMAEPCVIAPVLSQPSLPLSVSPWHCSSLHVSDEDLAIGQRRASEGCAPLALRFSGDWMAPKARFGALSRAFGDDIVLVEIDSSWGNGHGVPPWAHSVLTTDRHRDTPEHPTQRAFEQVVGMLTTRLYPEVLP